MINIIVGTETGTAEYVADEVQALLQQHQLNAEITLSANLDDLSQYNTCIICTSTHGAGDLPHNLQPLVQQIEKNDPDLSHLRFLVIALGDSNYDTFCQAGKSIHSLLEKQQARSISDVFTIDAMDEELPEDIAIAQLNEKISLFK